MGQPGLASVLRGQGRGQWSSGPHDSGGRQTRKLWPCSRTMQAASRSWCGASRGLGPNLTPRFLAAARPPFARAKMRARTSSARAERKAKIPLPIGVVRSSHCRSRALSVAPRAATRSIIRMPSIMERVARSHSASTSTSRGPSVSMALSSSGRRTPSRPDSLSLKTRLQPAALRTAS